MPKFYFDIHERRDFIDEVGLDLPDSEAAEAHALKMLVETVQWIGADWQKVYIGVRDEFANPVLRIDVRVTIRRLGPAARIGNDNSAGG